MDPKAPSPQPLRPRGVARRVKLLLACLIGVLIVQSAVGFAIRRWMIDKHEEIAATFHDYRALELHASSTSHHYLGTLHVLNGDLVAGRSLLRLAREEEQLIHEHLHRIAQYSEPVREILELEEINTACRQRALDLHQSITQASNSLSPAQLRAKRSQLSDEIARLQAIHDTFEIEERELEEETQQAIARGEATLTAVSRVFSLCTLALIVASIALALFLVLTLGRSVLRQLGGLVDAAEKIRSGDLSARAPVVARDELGHFASVFNEMATRLTEATADAQKASRAKGEFLAHMSHEIRTPLNGVVGMIDLLMGSDLSPQQRRYGQLAKSSADALLTVVNDILDFSKIEAGKLEITSVDFEPLKVAEEVMEALALRASAKDLELICQFSLEVPRFVRGDADRLRQVLINLVNNAIKFTGKGGVALRVTLRSDDAQGALVHFAISDTGIGIPSEKLARLFQAFSQADASTTRKYGGTGLGLAISKKLVELMGGTIGVESEENRGSTFWFTLPFALPAQNVPSPATTSVELGGTRVLVIDDHPLQRDALCAQLRGWGLDAEAAGNGEEGLRMLIDAAPLAPFRVAIIDDHLPGMNGAELARRVRARPDIAGTALMLLTPIEAALPTAQVQAMGFAAPMTKPVRQSQLFDAIMGALAPARALPAPQARETGAAFTGPRVLLAEDNEVNQIVATEIMTKMGYRCDVVGDGKQAVEAAGREAYAFVLMDCEMPEMDGVDATREIRKREAAGELGHAHKGRLPIIALTANAMKGDRERYLEAGMDAHVSKPINPKELQRAIDRVLSGGVQEAA